MKFLTPDDRTELSWAGPFHSENVEIFPFIFKNKTE